MKIYHFDRSEPLKIFDDLSKFKDVTPSFHYSATADTDGEFVFPLALLSERDGEEIRVGTSLVFDGKVTAGRATSFVTEGVDKFGVPFSKTLKLKSTEYQPLYLGVDTSGLVGKAKLVVSITGDQIYAVEVQLEIGETPAERMGDTRPALLSRLRWLNGREAANGNACKRYTPVKISGSTLSFLGRKVTLGDNGLPAAAVSYFEKNLQLSATPEAQYLKGAVRFTAEGEVFAAASCQITKEGDSARIVSEWESERLKVSLTADAKYEGAFFYRLNVSAKEDFNGALSLTVPYAEEASRYNVGLGLPGGAFRPLTFSWNPSHQDCMYIGDVNAGIRVKWKAENYIRPLINVYYKAQPLTVPETTWANSGAGRVRAVTENGAAVLAADTGEYSLKKGESHSFDFELHFTPFEPLDKKKMFGVRYYHKNFGLNPVAKIESLVKHAKEHGLNYIVVHHGNEINPFINYPFVATEAMEKLVRLAHAEGIGVKFYYTLRESSNHMAELFAYKAMGDEIILHKKFEGSGWMASKSKDLKRDLGEDIVSAWRVPFRRGKFKGQHDAAFIARPDSRLDNYYIEGLKFLTEVFHIDGIYIDDTSLDRSVLERARKVLDKTGGLCDMHMWNHEEERAGNAACVNLYTEIFPFIDSLWIGEGFDVKTLDEDYILTEVSGLPYGKPSQMLQDGGDPFCGMLYGMNNRYGWGVKNADRIYRLWDEFGIEKAEMRAYFDEKNPFTTSDGDVKVTSYRNGDKVLLAVYNFAREPRRFSVYGAEEYSARLAEIKGLQRGGRTDPTSLFLKGRGGVFLILQKK